MTKITPYLKMYIAVLDGAVVLPVMSDAIPNVLKFARTWAPERQAPRPRTQK